jgi:hypothetical protein
LHRSPHSPGFPNSILHDDGLTNELLPYMYAFFMDPNSLKKKTKLFLIKTKLSAIIIEKFSLTIKTQFIIQLANSPNLK